MNGLLKKLEASGKDISDFSEKENDFYLEIINYVTSWIKPFNELSVFDWMHQVHGLK